VASPHDDWSRLKDIFAHARALPSDARAAYLTEVCGGDESLRCEVDSLLASDERARGFLDGSPCQLADEATERLEGRCIGAYRIGSRIGAGGMGEVYEGLDTMLSRQVAINVLMPTVAPQFRESRPLPPRGTAPRFTQSSPHRPDSRIRTRWRASRGRD
jgi:serine/threonine-protein kinase